MPHVIEPASSGRAKCRGCAKAISKGELRFGERMENPYGEGEMTLWFHLPCGALKRPEPFLQTLDTAELGGDPLAPWPWLRAEAERGLQHRRLPRVGGVERASSGRARCRSCREAIAKGAFRIPVVYYEEGRFEPSGFVHAGCAQRYFGTADIEQRALCFSPELSDADRDAFTQALAEQKPDD